MTLPFSVAVEVASVEAPRSQDLPSTVLEERHGPEKRLKLGDTEMPTAVKVRTKQQLATRKKAKMNRSARLASQAKK